MKKNNIEINFLLIDGDHSYEGVKNDFEKYSTLLKKGFIIFDDITTQIGCLKFFNELKEYKKIKDPTGRLGLIIKE